MEFKIGNVVKTPEGNIVIVTNVTDTVVQWISFSHENSSGISKLADEFIDRECTCVFLDDIRDCNNECSNNKYRYMIKGFNRAHVLAPTVKDYIVERMLKNFEF